MRLRALVVLAVVPLLVAGGCRAQEEEPQRTAAARTASPDPELPEVQVQGTVLEVLTPSDAEAGTAPGADTDTELDTQTAAPATGSPRTSPTGSPRTSPTAAPADDDATATGGGAVLEITALSPSLKECGFDTGDRIAVFWEDSEVIEPQSVVTDRRFPANLDGQRLLVIGRIGEMAGQCVVNANRIEIQTGTRSGSPSPAVSPGPRGTSTTTPTTRPSPTRAPTARPTAAATPTPVSSP